MTTPKADLLQGTLDLLILKALSLGPLHGPSGAGTTRWHNCSTDLCGTSAFRACRGSGHRRSDQRQGGFTIAPAEDLRVLTFEGRRRKKELLDFPADARREAGLSSRGDRHGYDAIVANASRAVHFLLFHAHHT